MNFHKGCMKVFLATGLIALPINLGAAQEIATVPNEAPLVGKAEFQRNCASCHMGVGASYGGVLTRYVVEGREDAARLRILEGGIRMPAFKYMLGPEEVEDILTYIKSVEEPPETIGAQAPEPWRQ